MLLSAALEGPAVSRATAERLGPVRGALLDVGSRRLVALQIGRGRKASMVAWEALAGVGPDAAVVEGEAHLRPPAGDAEKDLVSGKIPLLGARVLTDRGNVHGTLDDVEFDPGSGAVLALRTTAGVVDAGRLLGHGRFAVVVAADPADRGGL